VSSQARAVSSRLQDARDSLQLDDHRLARVAYDAKEHFVPGAPSRAILKLNCRSVLDHEPPLTRGIIHQA
jgi:hypothetical protein